MASTQNTIRRLPTLTSEILGDSYLDFLQQLGGPAWFTVKGRDTSRRRVIVTLLHGNEPSGLKAVHALLSQEIVPATDLGILVAGRILPCVKTLTHRYIPGERDLNRCFKPPGKAIRPAGRGHTDLIMAMLLRQSLTHNTSSQ